MLRAAAAIIRERNHELSLLETLDTGKPLQETLVADAASGADCLEYFGCLAATMTGEYVDLGGSFTYTRREPLGVCVGIGAWNYPIQIACWKAAPALAAGNAMVFKPSEVTPLSALALAEIFTEAGLPDGVFNVVQGGGRVGAALVEHPAVAKVSITGSVATGERVAAGAAPGLKHVTLELGGKSPLLVFEDADLDNAISGAMLGNFYSSGQICSNGTRVFVHRDIHDEFVRRLVERTERIVLGDPLDEATQMGPLVSENQFRKVVDYLGIGAAEGARIATGGGAAAVAGQPDGWFVQPTVFTGVADSMRIAREEIFGPVMCVLSFDDERRGDRTCQRTRCRARSRGVHQGRATSPPGDRPPPGRYMLDQHLQSHADRGPVRRLQAVGHRPREQPRRPRPLQPAQERVRRSRRRRGAVLSALLGTVELTTPAIALLSSRCHDLSLGDALGGFR